MRLKLLVLTFAIVLCTFIVTSRLHYKFPFLYSWDSVQFALSIEKYDILKHQPQPPGYLFYSLTLKIVDRFIKDPNLTIIFINIASTIIASIFLFPLVFELTADCDPGIRLLLSCAATAIYSTNPIVWFYGCVSEIYAVEACLVSILCYLLFVSYRKPELLLLTSFLFGIAGGIRLTTEAFLLPAYLFVLFKANRKTILLSLLCITISNLLWLIPIVLLTGGINTYLRAVFNQGFRESSLTAGFRLQPFLQITSSLIQVITLPLSLLLFVQIKTIRIKAQEMFLLIAILPALLFFLFIHFPKYGYLLALVPTVIAMSISILRQAQYKSLILFGILLLSVISNYFIFTKLPIYTTAEVKNRIIKSFVYKFTFPNKYILNVQEERLKSFFTKISELGDRKKLFVVDKGYFPNFRIVMYYFPNDITVTLLSRKRATVATNHKIENVRQPIYLKGDERIVILIGPEPSGMNFHSFNVYEHEYYFAYLSYLPKGFRIYSFQFFKG